MIDSEHSGDRDRGAILLLVLAVAIVLSLVVLALANFVAADLRYSQVIDARAKTLSSAESGIDYAVDRLRLNQTLCATDAAASGPVSLNGTSTGPVGTALPQALNGTDTKITCERLDDDIADVAGWAVVIANDGTFSPPSDQVQVDMTGTATIDGPVFLPDPSRTATDNNSRVRIVDGDLWYRDCGTSYSNTQLSTEHIDVTPTAARGGICTPVHSGAVFSGPPAPSPAVLDTYPLNPTVVDDVTGCRVFFPGRYTAVPDFAGATADGGGKYHAYFMSGDYHFKFPNPLPAAEWLITNAVIWAGGPEPPSPAATLANGPCATARDNDRANGSGATFYVDDNSRITVGSGGMLEIFPRQKGNYLVSLQALAGSTALTNDRSVIRTEDTSRVDLVVHGLVWAPNGRVRFENDAPGSIQQARGGVVVKKLFLLRTYPPGFEIRPAQSVVKTRVVLSSTSTTVNGGSTTVEAVVDYRPDAVDLDDRVAITSFRVVD